MQADVPHSEEKIVKERLKGEHIAKYAKNLVSGSEEYTAKFSKYAKQNVAPEKISEYFTNVKAEIISSFKAAKPASEEKKAAKKAAGKPKTAGKETAPKEKESKKGEKKA